MFAPGDIVECVDARPFDLPSVPPVEALTVGSLYTVRRFKAAGSGPDCFGRPSTRDGVWLAEVTLPIWPGTDRELGWNAVRFRPVYRPDPGLIARLLNVPEPVAV